MSVGLMQKIKSLTSNLSMNSFVPALSPVRYFGVAAILSLYFYDGEELNQDEKLVSIEQIFSRAVNRLLIMSQDVVFLVRCQIMLSQ